MDLLIKGGTLVTPAGECQADLGVRDGKIVVIGKDLPGTEADRLIDAQGKFILPGLVDSFAEVWNRGGGLPRGTDFAVLTRAAALGGVTTLLMPMAVEAGQAPSKTIAAARKACEGHAAIDWGLHIATSDPGDPAGLTGALREHGITSIQIAFAAEDRGHEVDDGAALAIMQAVAGQAVVLAHCENGSVIRHLLGAVGAKRMQGGVGHAQAHPAWVEAETISRAAALTKAAGAHLCVSVVSSQAGLAAVHAAKEAGQRVFAMTTPHHLAMTSDLLEGDAGHMWAVEPPLRPRGEGTALWRGIESGLIDGVLSQHRAVPRPAKDPGQTDPSRCAAGLPGVETMLMALWSEGVEKWQTTAQTLAAAASEMPAKIMGLYPHKGTLEIGSDADIVIVDPSVVDKLDPAGLHMGVDYHPMAGKLLKGRPIATISRGTVLVENGQFVGPDGTGRWAERRFALP